MSSVQVRRWEGREMVVVVLVAVSVYVIVVGIDTVTPSRRARPIGDGQCVKMLIGR